MSQSELIAHALRDIFQFFIIMHPPRGEPHVTNCSLVYERRLGGPIREHDHI
jgi:hypothetical protein